MDWSDRVPEGVHDIEKNSDGFTGKVGVPLDEDGMLSRECPSCEVRFKISAADDDPIEAAEEFYCPSCGHRDDSSGFMTTEQQERVTQALHGMAEQYVHDALGDMFGKAFGGQRRSSPPAGGGLSISVTTSFTPGSPPPVRSLPEIVEERAKRTIHCQRCGTRYAVTAASAFCPNCGPRPAADHVLDEIAAARHALTLEDSFDEDERRELAALGVIERFAQDGVKAVVTLFEAYERAQFDELISDAQAATRGKGAIFQRLDDTAALLAEHGGPDLPALAGDEVWSRLRDAFAARHVLVHRNGLVDEKYIEQAPRSTLKVGQRLVVTRRQADRFLEDLETLVRAQSAAR